MMMKLIALFVCTLCVAVMVTASVPSYVHQGKQVTDLPNSQNVNFTSWAGYITVNTELNAKFFYWFIQSQNDWKTAPLVVWLTGGPGCSSELALLFENGPVSVDSELKLVTNDHSWHSNANLLYIDQPFGTGFSPWAPIAETNEEEIAGYLYHFMQSFLREYEWTQSLDFFLTGESYAGHYLPAFSKEIVYQNPNPNNIKMNFKGVAIGNGWVEPIIQYNYAPFAYNNKLINLVEFGALEVQYQLCQARLSGANTTEGFIEAETLCQLLLEEVLKMAPKIDGKQINVYNIKEPCRISGLCYNFTDQTTYMNLPGTKAALGVQGNTTWSTCSSKAGLPLLVDRAKDFSQDLVPVLAANVNVLIYEGVLDLICNWEGSLKWTEALQWPGAGEYRSAGFQSWTVNGKVVGSSKSAQGGLFTFLKVDDAGHMVPHDQPVVALAMLNQFLSGTPF